MARPFNPTPRKARFRGRQMHEVDCRRWKAEMQTIGRPLRRRFETLSEAEAWCRQLVIEHALGRPTDPGPVGLPFLCDQYVRSATAGKAECTRRTYEYQAAKFKAFLATHGIEDVRELTPAGVEMYRAALHAEELSANTIRAYLAFVTRVFAWGNRMGHIAGDPSAGVRLPNPRSRRRSLEDRELRALMTRGSHTDLWWLFLLTGLRRREMADLVPGHVFLDVPAPFLRVRGKGDKVRIVLLAKLAVDILRRYDYGYTYNGIYSAWVSDRKRCGLPDDLTPHSLRHTFLSWLANRAQVPIREVQAAADHATLRTTELYVHRDESLLRPGIERMAEQMLVSVGYQQDEESPQTRAATES